LVTGAGGSIGSELCPQIAQQNPKALIHNELNEFALNSIDIELSESFPQLVRLSCLGSITDKERLTEILTTHQVETVYHAAAYKHVPLVELNPAQAIFNNVRGTLVCAQAAKECRVERFVLISTDKAVRPTNIMGTTKRIAELILQAFSDLQGHKTKFIMVRFGNVLNSTGSVVPRFQKLINERRPITVTHPEITRYFMSIPEAARLVIQAGAMGEGGDVFLLDMGKPVKIYDLATQMIALSGLEVGRDIEIIITGLRPGEKLYEELLIQQDGAVPTRHPKIYAAKESMIPWEDLNSLLDSLFATAELGSKDALIRSLKSIVPEYTPASHSSTKSVTPERDVPLVSFLNNRG
ncbi:MAG: UDP-N-acetylglucosamine 4,6-dehydratase family protein, partial [Synechocystis sp.]